MRGIPGSGKSTRARELCHEALNMGANGAVICSTDDYHMVDGEYRFNRNRLGEFHSMNQSRVFDFMYAGADVIVVDNTNIKRKDMEPYLSCAKEFNYEVQEVVVGEESMRANMDAYITNCTARNTHGVPRDAIERMARSFQL